MRSTINSDEIGWKVNFFENWPLELTSFILCEYSKNVLISSLDRAYNIVSIQWFSEPYHLNYCFGSIYKTEEKSTSLFIWDLANSPMKLSPKEPWIIVEVHYTLANPSTEISRIAENIGPFDHGCRFYSRNCYWKSSNNPYVFNYFTIHKLIS